MLEVYVSDISLWFALLLFIIIAVMLIVAPSIDSYILRNESFWERFSEDEHIWLFGCAFVGIFCTLFHLVFEYGV